MSEKTSITQRELAEKLGITPVKLHRIINRTHEVSLRDAIALEKVSGIKKEIWWSASKDILLLEIKDVYGELNFTKGRPPSSKKKK